MIQTKPVQNWLVKEVSGILSKNLQAKVSIKNVNFQLFDKMLLNGTLLLDQKNDTLLYAGTAKVNITDWFFLKDKIVLKYVGLDDAFINLNRKDSVWNYQFLIDYFSGPKKQKTTSSNNDMFDLKVVEMNNIKIWQKDEWLGQNLVVSVKSLSLSADNFDFQNNVVKINSLSLNHPVFGQYNYKGLRPKRPHTNDSATAITNDKALQWNEDNWKFSLNNLNIQDGSFVIQNKNTQSQAQDYFDVDDINLSSINGNLHDVKFEQDTLSAVIKLSGKERSGFEVKKLNTVFRFTPKLMEFNKLDLVTNSSHLQDYYAMRYNNFTDDISDFIHNVKIEGNFKNSTISSNDLAYFAPEVKSWNRSLSINGIVSGTIDNLSAKKIIIKSGNENYFDGDVTLRGLPDINNTYIDFNSNDLRTNYNELLNFIPELKTISNPNLKALGNIRFKGKFTGFTHDFVTYGLLNTSIGLLKTDLNMKFPSKAPAEYSGTVFTDNFQLGKFINDNTIGSISFNGKVAGKGFTGENINVEVDGTVKQIQFNNYNYQNIIAKGNFKNKFFEGIVSIDDPNLKIDSLVGAINFKFKEPQFNFDAQVSKLNLKNLNFTKDNFSLTGRFNLNFSGSNIDNFLGSARIYHATLFDNDKPLSFDSLTIESNYDEGKKYLRLQTNELEASVTGNFKILELPDAFQLFLNRYYPAYIHTPKRKVSNEDFSFIIKTKNLEDYIPLLSPKLKGFDNSTISGDINLSQNTFNIQTNVPQFSFGPTKFVNTTFTGKGIYDSLSLAGSIEDIIINDSLHLPDTKISISAKNDVSDISVKTTASKTLNEADLSARVQTLTDGFKLYFNPSSFVINEKKWILEKGGELSLSNKLLSADEIKFVSDDHQISISTEPSSTGNTNDVLINLTKIDLDDVLPLLFKSPRIEGLMTGTIRVSDPFKNLSVEFETQTEQFRFEDDSIGVFNASGSYAAKSGDMIIHAGSENEWYNFNADFNYHAQDSTDNQLKGSVVINKIKIHFLEQYLSSVFNNITGTAQGEFNIKGRAANPIITGSANLFDASLNVIYTGCKYTFENNSQLTFGNGVIDFGTTKIRDTLNNTATLSGKIYHNLLDDFFFNEIHLKTDTKENSPAKFILLNTTSRDNKQFYGNVIGEADLSLNGPLNDMRMQISGGPTDSSHIYLPTGETAETGNINYIDFIKFGREMKSNLSPREESNLKVDMQLTANPLAKIDVILDEETKDVIKAQGSGTLNISAGTRDPLTIRGRYDVQEGQYTFNFQTFLKTPFSLQSGFIEWQGDPYLANLNIDAVYKAEKVDLSSIPSITNSSNVKGDIDIIFKLRGTLKEPKPEFEFQFTFDNPLKSDPIANEYLKTKFQSDKDQLNRQVTALLLFNTFISEQQGLLTANNTGNLVTRSLGQILSGTLSSSLSTAFQKIFKTNAVNLYTNINTSDFNFEKGLTQSQIQNLANFGFKTSFLNNRLLINLGGNVDAVSQSSANSNTNFLFTPDVSFEYLITPDGKLRVIGFNRSDAGITGDFAGLTRRNRTGIQLSYRKDFNTFNELFGIDKSK